MLKQLFTGLLLSATLSAAVLAADATPDALIKQITVDVIDTAKADKNIQAGDVNSVIKLVDAKVMPSVNFEAMTRSAVGPQWRGATPEQRSKLQAEFKVLLVRVYAGALSQIKDQTVEVTKTLPVPGGSQVVVQSEVKGKGDPIKLDYRLDKIDDGAPPQEKFDDEPADPPAKR